MSVFDELNNTEKIKPTSEWMRKWYDIMNNELFGGALGDCILQPFTTGKGSNGSTLGWFRLTGDNIKAKKDSRRIFQASGYGRETYITRENFVTICRPTIELNANYRASETSWINTLVHEMCHYYTYMFGVAPRQGHGPEFRRIGETVSSRSNGYITIQRLASAEEMKDYDLKDEIKQKNQERLDRKKSRTTALIVVMNSQVRLITTTLEKVITTVGDVHASRNDTLFYGSCNDASLIDFLVSKGYRSTMRTYRYWTIENEPWLNELAKYHWEKYMGSCNSISEALGIEENEAQQETPQQQITQNNPQDDNTQPTENDGFNLGWKIIDDNGGYNLINKEGKKSFPKPVDRIKFDKDKNCYYIQFGRITNNFRGKPGMWEKTGIWENKQKSSQTLFENKLRKIIKETIIDIINEKRTGEDDSISITPDMNLGVMSPLEGEGDNK